MHRFQRSLHILALALAIGVAGGVPDARADLFKKAKNAVKKGGKKIGKTVNKVVSGGEKVVNKGAKLVVRGTQKVAGKGAAKVVGHGVDITTRPYRWGATGIRVLGHTLQGKNPVKMAVGAPLAAEIRTARAGAIRLGLRPIPAHIRAQLAPHFSASTLARARYTHASAGVALPWLLIRSGNADAVTLGEVIVFRDARMAGSATLWAHELAHTEQYQRWGIDGFAQRYTRHSGRIEAEAERREQSIAAAMRRGPAPRRHTGSRARRPNPGARPMPTAARAPRAFRVNGMVYAVTAQGMLLQGRMAVGRVSRGPYGWVATARNGATFPAQPIF